MKRYIRSSVTSSKTVDDSNVKASTDNYNPYSFMVGDQLEWSGLYGGEYKGVVTDVTDEYLTVDVMWIAEDSGKLVTNTRRFEIATDPEGRECIIVYRYRGTAGYVYPPSNEYINSAEEYFDKVYGKCISEANQDINTIRRMYANNEGAPSTILLNLGYTEDESGEAFTKSMHTAGHIYETVFNFAKYDWEDGPEAFDEIVTYDLKTRVQTSVGVGNTWIESEGTGGALDFARERVIKETPEGYFVEKRSKNYPDQEEELF